MAIENIHSGTASWHFVAVNASSENCTVKTASTNLLANSMCALAEMYSLLLETYIKDPKEKSRLFHAIDEIPAIQRKAEWAMKWIQR